SPAKPGDALGWRRRGHPPRLHLAPARAWRRWWRDGAATAQRGGGGRSTGGVALATTAADCGSCRDAGPRHCSGCERRARDAFLHDASDPRVALHLRSASPRPDLDVWRLVALASDGGGWTGVAVAVAVAMAMVADGGGCGSDGGGYRRCYLWRRWLKAIIRLTVRHRRR
ncbi:Os02g0811902, partial [Oryza sativa Japonica Group]